MKLLEKWMSDYEESIFKRLMLTKELKAKWVEALKNQRTLQVNYWNKDEPNNVEIPEMRNCSCWQISPNWRREHLEFENYACEKFNCTFIVESIEIDGVMYDNLVFEDAPYKAKFYEIYKDEIIQYNGFAKLLGKHGCIKSDLDWLSIGRSDKEISEKAHKEMLYQKKAIEERVEKICGKELTHVDETSGEIYAKGSNGRTAHLWAITAGGYNIQCLHIRVLVKEVK